MCKNLHNKLYIFLFVVCSGSIFLSCENFADSKSISSQEDVSNKQRLKEQSKEKQFSYSGVSFWYDQSLAGEIAVKDTAGMSPCDPNFRPDACEPMNLSLQFAGHYADQHSDSSFHPEIIVYPIAEYIKLFQGSEDYSDVLDEKFQNLKTTISKQPSVIKGEYPFIPFVDATQILHSHLSYLSFKDGKGIGFVTQFNSSDPILVNNKNIVYVFQGITSNGKYLISATFPLKSSLLPDGQHVESHKGYIIPENFFKRENLSLNEENYKNYILSVEQELNSATDEQFTPNLAEIKKMLSSIEIKPEILERSL
jgi:hypothetical protein